MIKVSNIEEAYKKLNEHYFGGSLPDVMIYFRSEGKINHTIKIVHIEDKDNNKKVQYELPMSVDVLYKGADTVIANLLHMMVHIYCNELGLQDTSNNGRYHNSIFKEQAERVDLEIKDRDSVVGYEYTYPTEALSKVIKELGLDKGLNVTDEKTGGVDPNNITKIKPKQYVRKYVCIGCGDSVRSTKEVNIICAKCNLPMLEEQ